MKFKLLVVLLFASGMAFGQLPINGVWKYSFIDDIAGAKPLFDDSSWKTAESDKLKWYQNSYKDSSIVWVRKKVVIPSSLKNELEKTGALVLNLGRIKQEDKFFFNGKFAGETTSSDLKRAYVLNNILWDQENTLAVRVSHFGGSSSIGAGETLLTISAATAHQLFVMDAKAVGVTNKQQVKGKNAIYCNTIKNLADRTVNASLNADFYDFDGKKLKSVIRSIIINPGDNAYNFPYQSPSSFLKVEYKLYIPSYTYTAKWNDEYGYNNISYNETMAVVPYKVKGKFDPAVLSQQNIQGWLGEKLRANKEQRLFKVDETALLAGFINKPGTHPWIGEHVGKFLEAAVNTYKNTNDPKLKIQLDRTAQQLIASQLNDGYLGTYDAASQWASWDVWAHKYDLVGLLSYYELTGFKPALLAAEKIGDLLCKRFGLNPGQLDIIKSGEHVGMAATSILDPMTDLYRFSGKKEYLDFCKYITKSYEQKNGPKIISSLDSIGNVNKTANAKAYEMMSNLVGLVKLYRITADEHFLKPVLIAWKDITDKRLYITGTTSSFEHFQNDYLLPAESKDHMGEGCVTTTWVQLNFQLLSIFGKMEYVNELERSVYNHLIGAENPQTGCVSYYTPLNGIKPYKCGISCCMSSVPRGIAMIPLFADGKINGSPSILFYQPGVYKTAVNGSTSVEFTTKTNFPENGEVAIEVSPAKAAKFEVLLRKPYWAGNYKITVNGNPQSVSTDETISINRVWRKGDKINVSFTMPIKVLDGGTSYPGSVALQRGPQVLVSDNDLNPTLSQDFIVQGNKFQLQQTSSALPPKWVGSQAYQLKGDVNGEEKNIILIPYADAGQSGGMVTTWIKNNK